MPFNGWKQEIEVWCQAQTESENMLLCEIQKAPTIVLAATLNIDGSKIMPQPKKSRIIMTQMQK